MKSEFYYNDIPIGEDNAVSYEELMEKWGVNRRMVRAILHDLSLYDNGDNYIIIRSGHGKGFYKTDDVDKMQNYKQECLNKGKSNFAPVKKINRILNDDDKLQTSIFNNLQNVRQTKGLSQPDVVKMMWQYDQSFDVPLLSKMENSIVLPTPYLLSKFAQIYGCKTNDLVMVDLSVLDIYAKN